VGKYPSRVKCALLGWKALTAALAAAGPPYAGAATTTEETAR
jgi:NifU-like protein involved in Fe-S cluster formation